METLSETDLMHPDEFSPDFKLDDALAQYRELLFACETVVYIYDELSDSFLFDPLSRDGYDPFGAASAGELIDRCAVSDKDAQEVRASVELVKNRQLQSACHTLQLSGADGQRRWYNVRVSRLESDGEQAPRLMLSLRDINETMEMTEELRFRSERDSLTGLMNREAFFDKARDMIDGRDAGYYVVSYFDIDNFKVINDRYGIAKGDEMLQFIADAIRLGFGSIGGICCRVMADNFAAMYPSECMSSETVTQLSSTVSRLDGSIPPIDFSIGRYIVNDKSLPVSAMLDRASMAQLSVKGFFGTRIAYYDESMRESILREQEIISEMDYALASGQFEVWFQPQYNHSTGALIGAEALVRWRHPQRGLIPPNAFIPVFERNGFIYELDKFVWENACIFLRARMDAEYTALPVSVNVSRCDMLCEDFVDVISGLVDKYSLPADLLRLEITESAFASPNDRLIATVRKLTERGFVVEIDDFGSGYSSLSTLKDVPADILKLDMRFFGNTGDSRRAGNILESVVRMAKWLGMPVIAEGVETKQQADFLKSIGCSYIQGFLYARPMPKHEFEALAIESSAEPADALIETVEALDNNSFWDPASIQTLIFNSYVGGACVFELRAGKVELLRVNDKFARSLDWTLCAGDVMDIDWREHLDEKDIHAITKAIETAVSSADEASCEVALHGFREGGKKTYIRGAVRVIASAQDRWLLYCTIENATAQREAEQKERESSEQLRAIMQNVTGGVSAVTVEPDGRVHFAYANDFYFTMFGYTREQFSDEVQSVYDIIHADDRERVKATVERILAERQPETFEYRCYKRQGDLMHIRSNASVTAIDGLSDTVLLSVVTDTTELALAKQLAAQSAEQMRTIMENVNGGVTAVTVSGKQTHFIFANDTYFEQLGYTREQFFNEVRSPFSLVHPDDRERVEKLTRLSSVNREPFKCVFRAVRRDGMTVWISSCVSITSLPGINEPVQLAVASDITTEREAEQREFEAYEQLRFLSDISGEIIVSDSPDKALHHVLHSLCGHFGARRASIFEFNLPHDSIANTYSVSADDIAMPLLDLSLVRLTEFDEWKRRFNGREYLHVQTRLPDAPDDDILDKLREMGVSSLVVVPLRSKSGIIGVITIDDPTHNTAHFNRITAIGNHVSVILARRDLAKKLESDRLTLLALMNDTPGGFARFKMDAVEGLTLVFANEVFCSLVGMTRAQVEEYYGADGYWAMHPDDVEGVKAIVRDITQSGETGNTEFRLRYGGESDSYVRLNVFGRVTRDESGTPFINTYYTKAGR